MSEIRRDPLRMRWVLVDPDQPVRLETLRVPPLLGSFANDCPLCPGNEAIHGPTLYYACGFGNEKSGRESCIKVVPNGRPMLRVERELTRAAKGPYDLISGVGAHEVIIETPDHSVDLADLHVEAIAQMFFAARARIMDLRNDGRLRYHLLFKQHGREAGARVDHSHSQILATPEIPPYIKDELNSSLTHFRSHERCLFCDMHGFEMESGARLVTESSKYSAYVPYASARPFETWIFPKRHGHDLVDASIDDIRDLARMLKEVLGSLNAALETPAYHMTLINAPSTHAPPGREGDWSILPHAFHWRLAIVPRVTAVPGLDWDTGLAVNPVAPERAAAFLRSIKAAPR